VRVPELANVVDVVASDTSFCALTRSGEVLCWGENTHGQLGRGTFDDGSFARPTPVSIGP
jgi:alpha-tubulin suppressor-like RCC1 family protein